MEQLYQRLSQTGRLSVEELTERLPGLGSEEAEEVRTEQELAGVLARVSGCETVDLGRIEFDAEALSVVPAQVVRATRVLPLYFEEEALVVAQYDPLDVMSADRVKRVSGRELKVLCGPREQILFYIETHYGSREQAEVEEYIRRSREEVEARRRAPEPSHGLLFREYEEDLGEAPVEQLLEALVAHAVQRRAADIHINCHGDRVELRHRIDGVLREPMRIPEEIHSSLVTRVKLSAGMDVTRHRLPQEGKFEVQVEGTPVQVRASIFPSIHGEDVALRLLHRSMYLREMGALGFDQEKLGRFKRLLDSPKGMLLVTGPVGVGKTTTLYSALNRLSEQRLRIVTLEDPVECRLENISQSQISPRTGYSFARGLRSILRMDPDVIMVGEIRDVETARMALRASLTGMLVLSTLHTDRAAGAVARLLDMEVEPYLLTSSLLGVLSQALVRTICADCKEPAEEDGGGASDELSRRLGDAPRWHGAGCVRCE